MKRLEIKGERFGILTVLESKGSLKGHSRWLCICDCGKRIEVDGGNLKRGQTKSCGCSWEKKGKNHPNFKGYESISRAYFNAIKQSSFKRNFEFSVSEEYLWELYTNQNMKCSLSGLPISFGSSHDIKRGTDRQTASLDRIDSKIGYIEGNVQWVHKEVNRIKQNLKQERFIELCHLIVNNNKKP